MTTKAWGGRFTESTAAIVEAMNASVGFDQLLAFEDIAGSIAHSRMLAKVGIISADDQRLIEDGLVAIAAQIREGKFTWTVAREDVHMNVEGALADRIGPAAGRLHTGRSRNDQVALDLRLWLRKELTALGHDLGVAITRLLDLAEQHADLPMPGYTHLQRAQPITFGHHLSAWAMMLSRDLDRLVDARRRVAVSPLGSGALAGTPLPIDRYVVAAELELPNITLNSLDGVADRDGALESLSVLSICMIHLSRIAEELVLWASQEFAFIELSDAFCTGSSLMPQKKNPDIPELLRGKAGRVVGAQVALLMLMKGLPLAYNKDMQEDKEPLFDAMKTARQCVAILPDLFSAMKVRPDRLTAAMQDGYLLATDLADFLVDVGVPFREAHHIVGAVVGHCVASGKRLEDLDVDEYRSISEHFDSRVIAVLDAKRSLSRRSLPGGPAPEAVRRSILEARSRLDELARSLASGGPSAIERALVSGTPLPAPLNKSTTQTSSI
jgi:argininosuccinate lyase